MDSGEEDVLLLYCEEIREKVSSPPFLRRQRDIPQLYQAAKDCGGELVLPIRQGFDRNVIRTEGLCGGYVLKWAADILTDQSPFGTPLNAPAHSEEIPEFISLTDALNRHTLFHRAPATQEFFQLQNSQNTVGALALMQGEYPVSVDQCDETFLPRGIAPSEMARDLVEIADEHSDRVYYIVFYESRFAFDRGHAAGFYKDSLGNYHYMDSQFGWLRFPSSEAFERWFPEIFTHICKEYPYLSYKLVSYGGTAMRNAQEARERSMETALKTIPPAYFVYMVWKLAVYVIEMLSEGISHYCSSPQPSETLESTPLMTP